MKDRHGNDYEPPKPVRLKQDDCEVTTCHSNTGFSCSLSVYDHKDAINPAGCHHRKWINRDKSKERGESK
jgi:hypothetical protein